MSRLIELGSGTANHRTFHFRLFTSDGTTPDTGASNDSVIVARGSTTTFTPDVLVTAVHAAQGMYSVQLTQSNVSNLGQHAIYHTQGSFPQHVANFDVVNFNPYSNWSNAAQITHSGVTFGSGATILTGGIVAASFAAGAIDATAIAADAIGSSELATSAVAEIAAASADSVWDEARTDHTTAGSFGQYVYSDVTRISDDGTAADNLEAFFDGTGYTSAGSVGVVRIAAGTYSGVTVGSAATILAGTYSGVTVGINDIAAATYSGVTVGSAATILPGGIIATSFGASAIDAAALAVDAGQEIADRVLSRNIAGGNDSSRSVGQALFVLRNRVNATSSVGTVYQNDDTTSAFTFSITTGANPIAQVDPT